jgi:hypothetical protein
MYFFEIENGFKFRDFSINGKRVYIHDVCVTQPFSYARSLDRDDHFRCAVIRDPVERLLSCYSNRVVHHGELSAGLLSPEALEAGWVIDPTLDQFLENLEGYRAYSPSIAHHSDPLVCYLGEDPRFFSKLYTIRQLDQLVADVSALANVYPILGHEQSQGPKFSVSGLSARQIRKLKDFYAQDYEVFGSYFTKGM